MSENNKSKPICDVDFAVDSAVSIRHVHDLCCFHDFLLCTVFVDCDFRHDVYLHLKASPVWFGLPDRAWSSDGIDCYIKLAHVRSSLMTGLDLLDEGPANVLSSTLTNSGSVTAFALELSSNVQNNFEEVKMAFSFVGEGTVACFDGDGTPLRFRIEW